MNQKRYQDTVGTKALTADLVLAATVYRSRCVATATKSGLVNLDHYSLSVASSLGFQVSPRI